MQTLPPLPLIDGCLFIDNSSWVEGMSTCYRYLQYKSLNLRVPATAKPSLSFGSAIHLALEHRYKNYGPNSVTDKYYSEVAEILTSFFDANPPPVDDWRTLNWAMEVVRKYNERYGIEEFSLLAEDGKPMVELTFSLPLFTWEHPDNEVRDGIPNKVPIIYSGRIDLPVSLDGKIFVMDHKTTSLLGPQFFTGMKMSAQQKGYCWAFRELTKMDVSGYVINAIRTKEPPQYVVGNTKQGKYTPETWWAESLQRERYYLGPNELDEWKQNTISLVEEFFFHYQRGYMPMKTHWCNQYGKCPYYDVCSLPQNDRGVMLNSGLFEDNTWSPLKQPSASKQ